jgi:hypothetical protein
MANAHHEPLTQRRRRHKFSGVKLRYQRRLRRMRQARATLLVLIASIAWIILVNLLTAIHFSLETLDHG